MTRSVLIFRQNFLPDSETFIADHISKLGSWKAIPICETNVENSHVNLMEGHSVLNSNEFVAKIQRKLLRNFGLNRSLSRLIHRTRPSLIHAHFLTDASLIMRYASQQKLPLVATAHGYDASMWDEDLSQTPTGKWYVENRAELAATVSKIFCVSDFIREELLQKGFPAAKLVVQRLGVDTALHTPGPEAGECSGVLFVGRLVEKKGATTLVKAWRELSPELRSQGLTIIGGGPQAEQLAQMAAPHPEIRLLGVQPRSRVLKEMRQCRIVALPSLRAANGDSEGLPIAAMEAHSLARPMVGFDDGPIGEAIENNVTGFVVVKKDFQAFAAAMGRLLADDELATAMGLSARHKALKQFDITKNVAALENLYHSVVF